MVSMDGARIDLHSKRICESLKCDKSKTFHVLLKAQHCETGEICAVIECCKACSALHIRTYVLFQRLEVIRHDFVCVAE